MQLNQNSRNVSNRRWLISYKIVKRKEKGKTAYDDILNNKLQLDLINEWNPWEGLGNMTCTKKPDSFKKTKKQKNEVHY